MMNNMEQGRGGRGAFTLMEMLIVLGIMGLLAGLGFSGIQGIRQLMKKSGEQAIFLELQTACRLYYLDHAGWPECFSHAELALSDPRLSTALGPYMETRVTAEFLESEFTGQTIHVVIDKDHDHWIRSSDFSAIGESQRPPDLWERAAVYSLDSEGHLWQASWKE